MHYFKENQPCHAGQERLKVVQQGMRNSRDKDPSDRITESDVEDAATESLISNARGTDAIMNIDRIFVTVTDSVTVPF